MITRKVNHYEPKPAFFSIGSGKVFDNLEILCSFVLLPPMRLCSY